MTDFGEILLYHFKKYPLMTPQDTVKLCYQSAFGCGHLIKNEEYALSMLEKEITEIEAKCDAHLFESIGNGYVRMDLHRAKAEKISMEKILEAFIKSANEGHRTEIEDKIEILKKLTAEKRTPFSEEVLLEYLSKYNGEMVSHSETYRENYSPAYRVILESLIKDLQ